MSLLTLKVVPKRITNSELKQFKRCKRQWWLASYRGLRRSGAHDFNRPLGIGTRVHDALAAYYHPTERQDPIAFLDAGLARDIAANSAYESEITKEGDLARIMLEGYVQWVQEEGKDVGYTILSTEGALEVPLFAGATILSKLDARVQDPDGNRLALEHKTTGGLNMGMPTLKLDTQLLTEHLVEYMSLLAEGREGEAAHGILYNMLLKSKRTARAKGPFYRRETVHHNVDELRNHWRHVYATAAEILRTEAALGAGADHHDIVPPNPTRDCSWDCPFYQVCVMADDGSDFEGALANLYEVRDPLERYDDLLAANAAPDKEKLSA